MPTTDNINYLKTHSIRDDISPDTEVFYIPSTNEIFETYNDYFERMIQLNSACWTCTITGKIGLTYDEALQSEKNAKEQGKHKNVLQGKLTTQKQLKRKQSGNNINAASEKKAADVKRTNAEIKRQQIEDSERKKQIEIERKKRERELLIKWRKPRDDLLCDDLKPFPHYKELCWPSWVPKQFYWDILSIQSFLHTFAEVIFQDKHNPFTLTSIATALVSHQTSESSNFYQLMDWLLTAVKTCLNEDEGDAADLNRPEQIGNELNKDIDHPIHGEEIRRINKECEQQKKIHGAHIRGFSHERLYITEIIRLHLQASGYYTMWRRQMRGMMHCYEDDGYVFVRNEPEIMELLKVSSIFALSPMQRVKLINVFINQLASHQRFRNLIDQRIDQLFELKKELRRLKNVDQQHERDARDAQQTLAQSEKALLSNGNNMLNDVTNKSLKAAKRELEILRRALTQLNEGRRVQNIAELREGLLSEQKPLPWSLMQSVSEIQEFRAAQHNFHGDKIQNVIKQIYELQGKMGIYYLGKDRAFRNYYYMCSAFIIYCHASTELGCCSEPTPMQKSIVQVGRHPLSGQENEKEHNAKVNNSNINLSNGNTNENNKELGMDNNHECNGAMVGEKSIDCFMLCTGQPHFCPVHNPPVEWPRLLYYIEQDAVKKLLDSLNPRGFRESELAYNIRLFKEIYKNEILDTLDRFSSSRSQLSQSAQLFGFSATPPKELINCESSENSINLKSLWAEVRNELLELENNIFERRLGTIHCTVDREQWRQMLENNVDTSQCCIDNCICIMYSQSNPCELLYTPEELSRPEQLSSVQKLGIALIQLAQGIHLECLQSPFVIETKKNGTVVKRTPKETFVEWQRALKKCESPSAVALFERTFEYAVNWDYNNRPEEMQHQSSTNSKVGRRRQQQLKTIPNSESLRDDQEQQPSTSTRSRNHYPTTRSNRELDMLIKNANYAGLLVTGTRQRKQVTKYGDVEMDIDKLNFDEDDDDHEEDEDVNTDKTESYEDDEIDEPEEVEENSEIVEDSAEEMEEAEEQLPFL